MGHEDLRRKDISKREDPDHRARALVCFQRLAAVLRSELIKDKQQ